MPYVDYNDLLPLMKSELRVRVEIDLSDPSGPGQNQIVKVTLLWGDEVVAEDRDTVIIPERD